MGQSRQGPEAGPDTECHRESPDPPHMRRAAGIHRPDGTGDRLHHLHPQARGGRAVTTAGACAMSARPLITVGRRHCGSCLSSTNTGASGNVGVHVVFSPTRPASMELGTQLTSSWVLSGAESPTMTRSAGTRSFGGEFSTILIGSRSGAVTAVIYLTSSCVEGEDRFRGSRDAGFPAEGSESPRKPSGPLPWVKTVARRRLADQVAHGGW